MMVGDDQAGGRGAFNACEEGDENRGKGAAKDIEKAIDEALAQGG